MRLSHCEFLDGLGADSQGSVSSDRRMRMLEFTDDGVSWLDAAESQSKWSLDAVKSVSEAGCGVNGA